MRVWTPSAAVGRSHGWVEPDVVLHPSAYARPSAHIYGRVAIGEGASVWINAAMRAEHCMAVRVYPSYG